MGIRSEWDLIDAIRKRCASGPALPQRLIRGIGDDAAVFDIGGERCGIITTDMSVEDVHFTMRHVSPEDIGYKAFTCSVSDIAAMGGKPKYAFISIGIPGHLEESYIMSVYAGMIEASEKTGCYIAGGDTSRSEKLVIGMSIYGESGRGGIVFRKGASIGESIYITGSTGGSAAGLMLLAGNDDERNEYPALMKKHLRPDCRTDIIGALADAFKPTAMIDVSDGILSDLRHLSAESGTGFIIDADALPLADGLERFCSTRGLDPRALALESGEEYELLFTSKEKTATVRTIMNIPVTRIGEVTRSGYALRSAGTTSDAGIKGYDHFKKD